MNNRSITPDEMEAAMTELCLTTNRDALYTKGFALIRTALGDGAVAYLPSLDMFLERVKQLGRPIQVTPYAESVGGVVL